MISQNRITIQQRLDALHPDTLIEKRNHDELERAFADTLAEEDAAAISKHYFKGRKQHAQRIVELLAKELVGSKSQDYDG